MTIEVDPQFQEVTIEGQKYPFRFFEFMAGAPEPTKFFRIVRRKPDARFEVIEGEALVERIVNQVLWELEELCKFDVDEWLAPLKKAIERGLE